MNRPCTTTTHVHNITPGLVRNAAALQGEDLPQAAWIEVGPVTIYATTLHEIAAIGEQIKLCALRAHAETLLDTNPFRGAQA